MGGGVEVTDRCYICGHPIEDDEVESGGAHLDCLADEHYDWEADLDDDE